MPIDPRELKRFRHHKQPPIDHDRPCRRCGYNLRGLRGDGVCPECGTPIERTGSAARLRDSLADAPRGYLSNLLFALVLMVIGSISGVLILFIFPSSSLKGVLLLAAAGAWWFGVFLVTAERHTGPFAVPDEALDSRKFRLVNRILQASWGVVVLVWLNVSSQPGWLQVVSVAGASVLTVVAFFSLVPLSVHLAALAEWASESSLAARFRATAWGLAAFGLLVAGGLAMGLTFRVLGGFMTIAFAAALGGIIICQVLFLIWLMQLALSVEAAIRNADFAHQRDLREQERLLGGGEREDDRTCPSCGYSLKGLPPLARCPECGWLDPELRHSHLAALATGRGRK